jgi:hypothetical protein
MSAAGQRPPRDAVRVTEVCFDAAVWEVLEREAARLGVSVAEYVHDAALERAAPALRAPGEDPSALVAGRQWMRPDEAARDRERRTDQERLSDAQAQRHRDVRDEAAAVRAQSGQAQRRAAELRGQANAILDTVALIVTDVLRRHGFALLAPVAARFRTAEAGNTGVEVAVRLADPSQAGAAKAAIVERFPDRLSEVIVS